MKARSFTCAVFLFLAVFTLSSVSAADKDKDDKGNKHQFPQDATFRTLIVAPHPTEGLTGDNRGNLYTGGNNNIPPAANGTNCPIWRISLSSPSLVQVGTIPGTCNPLGIAFNDLGDLFVANGATGTIWTFDPNTLTPPATATQFATGVPGANGIAFDRHGNL